MFLIQSKNKKAIGYLNEFWNKFLKVAFTQCYMSNTFDKITKKKKCPKRYICKNSDFLTLSLNTDTCAWSTMEIAMPE